MYPVNVSKEAQEQLGLTGITGVRTLAASHQQEAERLGGEGGSEVVVQRLSGIDDLFITLRQEDTPIIYIITYAEGIRYGIVPAMDGGLDYVN